MAAMLLDFPSALVGGAIFSIIASLIWYALLQRAHAQLELKEEKLKWKEKNVK